MSAEDLGHVPPLSRGNTSPSHIMEAASALAQIKACMAAPSNPVACVVLRAGGTTEEVVTDQRKMGEVLGAPPTIVGEEQHPAMLSGVGAARFPRPARSLPGRPSTDRTLH